MDEKMQKALEEELDKFIKSGKKRGAVAYEEVIEVFDKYELTEEEFEDIWNALDKNGIVLSTMSEDSDDATDAELSEIDGESEEIEREIEEFDKDVVGDDSQMADSVHMYLKEIGSVDLLSMEEEIELAKRIEKGKAAERENEELQRKIDEIKNRKTISEKAKKEKENYQKKIRNNKKIIADSKEAIDHLTSANLRLVVSNAKHYLGRGMSFLDVIHPGG